MNEKIERILKKLNLYSFTKKNVNNFKLKKQYKYDYKFYKNNYIISENNNLNKDKYYILYLIHSIEKGMTNANPRPFGVKKIEKLITLLDKVAIESDSFEYNMGMSCLKSYSKFYERNNFQNSLEYNMVIEYIRNKEFNEYNVGSYEVSKDEIINNFDYFKFLSSRHSIRAYSNKKISNRDINEAIKMVSLTPSACNRQMCKVYYISDDNKKNIVIKYGHGFGNFDKKSINLFIITFDVNSNISIGERNQGWFNSGLFAMNFVNALHSLGIGSCFVQFGNSSLEEKSLKNILNISESERIAVIISAGYYLSKSCVTYSTRKPLEDIYKKI